MFAGPTSRDLPKVITALASMSDAFQGGFCYFLASKIFQSISLKELVKIAGLIGLARYQVEENKDVAMVFRNGRYFSSSFFSLLFKQLKYPVAEEDWQNFFESVKDAHRKAPEKKEEKDKAKRRAGSRIGKEKKLEDYFAQPPEDILNALLPVYHDYLSSNKQASKKHFMNSIAFAFIGLKACQLVNENKLSSADSFEVQKNFKALHDRDDFGIMAEFVAQLDKKRAQYELPRLAPDTIDAIGSLYDRYTNPDLGFQTRWERAVAPLQNKHRDLILYLMPLRTQPAMQTLFLLLNQRYQVFQHQLFDTILSFEEIESLAQRYSSEIDNIVGPAILEAAKSKPEKKTGNPTEIPAFPRSFTMDQLSDLSDSQLPRSFTMTFTEMTDRTPPPPPSSRVDAQPSILLPRPATAPFLAGRPTGAPRPNNFLPLRERGNTTKSRLSLPPIPSPRLSPEPPSSSDGSSPNSASSGGNVSPQNSTIVASPEAQLAEAVTGISLK